MRDDRAPSALAGDDAQATCARAWGSGVRGGQRFEQLLSCNRDGYVRASGGGKEDVFFCRWKVNPGHGGEDGILGREGRLDLRLLTRKKDMMEEASHCSEGEGTRRSLQRVGRRCPAHGVRTSACWGGIAAEERGGSRTRD